MAHHHLADDGVGAFQHFGDGSFQQHVGGTSAGFVSHGEVLNVTLPLRTGPLILNEHHVLTEAQASELVRPTGRTSAVWQHFKIVVDGKRPGRAICDYCGKDVQHGSSTSNLASHLRVRHPDIVADTDLARPPPCLGPDRKPRMRKPKAETQQTNFEDAFLKWAVATGESPDICDDANFRRMIQIVNPKAKIPSRERLEMAFKMRESSVNVDMVLQADHIAPISWIASIMTTLRRTLRSQANTAAAEDTRAQMVALALRWGGSDDAPPSGIAPQVPNIPNRCLMAAALDPRFKRLKSLEKYDRRRAWMLVQQAAEDRHFKAEKAAAAAAAAERERLHKEQEPQQYLQEQLQLQQLHQQHDALTTALGLPSSRGPIGSNNSARGAAMPLLPQMPYNGHAGLQQHSYGTTFSGVGMPPPPALQQQAAGSSAADALAPLTLPPPPSAVPQLGAGGGSMGGHEAQLMMAPASSPDAFVLEYLISGECSSSEDEGLSLKRAMQERGDLSGDGSEGANSRYEERYDDGEDSDDNGANSGGDTPGSHHSFSARAAAVSNSSSNGGSGSSAASKRKRKPSALAAAAAAAAAAVAAAESANSISARSGVFAPKKRRRLIGGAASIIKKDTELYVFRKLEPVPNGIDVLQWWKAHASQFPILSGLALDLLVYRGTLSA